MQTAAETLEGSDAVDVDLAGTSSGAGLVRTGSGAGLTRTGSGASLTRTGSGASSTGTGSGADGASGAMRKEEEVSVLDKLRTRTNLEEEPARSSRAQHLVTRGVTNSESDALHDDCEIADLSQQSVSSLGHTTSGIAHSSTVDHHVTHSSNLLQPSLADLVTITHTSTSHVTVGHTQLRSPPSHVSTTSLAHLMYTSPPLHPTLTTSPFLPDHAVARVPSIPASSLQVTDVHQFSDVCCMGISTTDYIQVTNLGERWLQVRFAVTRMCLDGQQLAQAAAVFSFPEKSYIDPCLTRLIKVTDVLLCCVRVRERLLISGCFAICLV